MPESSARSVHRLSVHRLPSGKKNQNGSCGPKSWHFMSFATHRNNTWPDFLHSHTVVLVSTRLNWWDLGEGVRMHTNSLLKDSVGKYHLLCSQYHTRSSSLLISLDVYYYMKESASMHCRSLQAEKCSAHSTFFSVLVAFSTWVEHWHITCIFIPRKNLLTGDLCMAAQQPGKWA